MSDNRPTVYLEGENVIYRASGLGSCVKYLVAAALGYEDQRGQEMEDLLERSANEGYLHEDSVVARLEAEGIKVVGRQDEINIQIIPKVFIRGHQEGLLLYPDERRTEELLEIKSMSTKQFTKWTNHKFGQFERYAWQISVYMQAHPNFNVKYIVKRREDGFVDEVKIKAGQPPIPMSVIRKKVLIAEKWRRKGELPPCDTANQWGCPVWYLHDEDDDVVDEPMTEEMQTILGELVAEYRELKEIEERGKAAEDARKKINPEILNMMGSQKQVELEFKGVKYRVTKQGGGGKKLNKALLMELVDEEIMKQVETPFKYSYPVIRTI